jgi:hypothetical protein
VTHPQIAAFARLAKENTLPLRRIEGQKTKISRTMHGFAYDAIHDEIVVNSALSQAILTFRGDANGEQPPIRVIQGPRTKILGTARGGNDKVSIDPDNNEILLPTGNGGIGGRERDQGTAPSAVLVFDRMASGDVAPKRILTGPDTQIEGVPSVVVDPTRNLLFVNSGGKMLIFDRTASGNAKPKAIIAGPRSQMGGLSTLQTYPAKGLIVGGCSDNSICAWSVNDNGDIPPRYKVPAAKITGYRIFGVALDPVHKEIILPAAGHDQRPPNGIMNAVLTFSWPELFE